MNFGSKKTYNRPELFVHGNVEQVTQNVFKIGTGDTFGQPQIDVSDSLASR